MERKAWMDQDPPPNYVAGLGRGATGFTTRSDIGPARTSSDPVPIKGDDDNDKGDYSESNYDEFEGFGGSLFDSAAPYEADDREADEIYAAVEARMDSRRKVRREQKLKEEMDKNAKLRPKIQSQFADLKSDLSKVTQEQWDSIPDVVEGFATTRFRKKAKTDFGTYVPVPDSLIEKAKQDSEYHTTLDVKQQEIGGFETPLGSGLATPISGLLDSINVGGLATPSTDLIEVGAARKQMLSLKMKSVADSVSGQTVVDPKSYLSDLSSIKVSSEAEIGDIKKARLLLKSVRQTNPKHGPGWIAAARLEEVAGKLTGARKLITEATQVCPDSEDVWLEAARLHTPDVAKSILAKAIKHVPKSVKVWSQAANLETDIKLKKKVLRKALEFIPNSVKLWKAAIELEEPEDAKIMLSRAVECVPHSVDMWLALAHLESYENAKKVLNKARQAVPTDHNIWITAAKLEEANSSNDEIIKNIIKKAIKSLQTNQVTIDREMWIKEAEQCEKTGAVVTCQSIIREILHIGIDDQDRKRTWVEDAESCIARNSIETARAIYATALAVFPGKKGLWLRAAHLEKSHGTKESLEALLKKAVNYCPQAEVLWLMAAKERWLVNDVDGSREILKNAFAANPNSEQIWLAAVKLEYENNELNRARALLEKARKTAGTERVWLKSALLERDVGNMNDEISLLEESLKLYPQFPKFWLMRAQLEERLANKQTSPNYDKAREIYQRSLKNCPHSVPVWISAVRLEEKISTSKARSMLEKARAMNPKNPDLWIETIRIEIRSGNHKMAVNLMSKALQECPQSGILWAESIEMETNPQQKKGRSVEALKRCDNDPNVILAVAKLFWSDRKYDKTRTWLNRSITLNSDYGDAWAYLYKFELQHGNEEQQQTVLKKCVDADPRHGQAWILVSKDPANTRMKTEQILKRVVNSLPNLDS